MHVSLVRRICFVGGTHRSPECIAVKLNHGIALECRKEKCRVNYFFFLLSFMKIRQLCISDRRKSIVFRSSFVILLAVVYLFK